MEKERKRRRRSDAKYADEKERYKYNHELRNDRNRIRIVKKYFDKVMASEKEEIKKEIDELMEELNWKYVGGWNEEQES